MADERGTVLTYAIRGPVVLKYLGQLALILALLTLVPLVVALVAGDDAMRWRYGPLCTVLLLLGGLFARLPAPLRIQGNEALTVTALAFLGASLLMSWPIMGTGVPFVDALFEAVSGVTTTGLSTLTGIEMHSTTLLFTRAWMQWYGGLGFVVLSVALLMGHQAAARRLSDPAGSGETLVATARTHARHSLMVYVALTLVGLALVWALTGNGFMALLQVLSAVSTGGFSSYPDSLAGLASRPPAVAVMLIAFLGAVSLPLYWRAAHAGRRTGLGVLLSDVELRGLLAAALVIGILLSGLGWLQGRELSWYHGFMMGVSAQTTTGFTTMSITEMDAASKVVMIVSMLLGGSVGSSAGGFKLLRLLILLRLLQLMIRRTGMPMHAVAEPYLGGRKLESDDVLRALQLIILFIGLVVVSWLPFVVMGYDPLDALFEVVSASGTVGLSSGITRPGLEPLLKGVLCFDMLAGRLEIIAILVVLYPRNWFGRRKEVQ
jgi:trk system potassium uptake protein TrkH